MHYSLETHMEAAKKTLQQSLKATPGSGFLFSQNGHVDAEAYVDIDYSGSMIDRRSTLAIVLLLEVT